MKPYQVYFLKG